MKLDNHLAASVEAAESIGEGEASQRKKMVDMEKLVFSAHFFVLLFCFFVELYPHTYRALE